MEDRDLEKLFAAMDVPAPDTERRKETLNVAVAAFEAQKSAVFENNSKSSQGSGWWSRLTSQNNQSERKDDMTGSNKKFLYGGLMGGIATACVVLMIYGNEAIAPQTMTQTEQASSGDFNEVLNNIGEESLERSRRMGEERPREQDMAQADIAEAPAAQPIAPHLFKEEARAGKGALPLPQEGESLNLAEAAQAPAPMPMAQTRGMSADMAVAGNAMSMAVAPPGAMVGYAGDTYAPVMENEGRDNFKHVDQNEIKQVKADPVSTFSIDVDTSSYSFVRQSLDNGLLPEKDAVRVEEMINYFDYAYPVPQSKEEPFSTNVVVKDSPWNKDRKLMTIGIKGYDVEQAARPDSNLVFLLDTSGSMDDPKKLPLLKQSFSMLLDSLKPTDKVSIVVYAGAAGTVLQPTEVSNKGDILQALNNLSAGGSTAGGEGIRMAYELAQKNFDKDAVNRVILATDGDFNVGISDPEELKGFIEREREKGVFLSVLGFGTGNYNDALMQELAQNGNGIAAYIDTLNEARKVLVQESAKALFPIAKDVKIQVEFNPATVSEYRLVGYETRALKTEDFNNDKVDAGDIGAGSEVTAIYEVTPAGAPTAIDVSRYAADQKPVEAGKQGELAFVKVRYKLPNESVSKLITTPVAVDQKATDEALLRETGWAESVAGFGQLLKGGQYTGMLTYDDVIKQAEANKGSDPFGYRTEFINLVYKAKTAASMPAQSPPGGYGEQPVPYLYQYR